MSSTEPLTASSDDSAGSSGRKVLVTDPIDDAGLQRLRDGGCKVNVQTDLSTDALRETLSEYDAIVVRSNTKLTADVIEANPNLSVIGRAGVGVDNIDIDAATEQGVLVTNAPSGNTVAVAEHTLALLFALVRDIPGANDSLSHGEWNKSEFFGTELMGQTLGIVGFGRIGREVAERADALGMDVVAFDPYLSEQAASTFGVELLDLPELLERSAVVSIHTPLTDETHHLLGAAEFERMNDEAYLVHPARGGVVDEEALGSAIENDDISGAAVDVFENEPPASDNPLLTADGVLVTPHVAAKTDAAMNRVATTIADNVLTSLNDEVPESALNAPYTDDPDVQETLELGRILGRLGGELTEGAITSINIEYRGQIADTDVEPVTVAACVGLLDPVLDERVNRISVPLHLEDRDVEITEYKTSQSTEFVSKLVLTVETDEEAVSVEGTVGQTSEPLIVGIDGYKVKVSAPDDVVVFYGRDTPGVIGEVGNLLAEHDINIAGMYNSREEVGGETIMVVAVDSPVSPELEGEFRDIENITDVCTATLTS